MKPADTAKSRATILYEPYYEQGNDPSGVHNEWRSAIRDPQYPAGRLLLDGTGLAAVFEPTFCA